MEVELRKIEDIRPYEQNPRLNGKAVDAVATSLQEFGFRQPGQLGVVLHDIFANEPAEPSVPSGGTGRSTTRCPLHRASRMLADLWDRDRIVQKTHGGRGPMPSGRSRCDVRARSRSRRAAWGRWTAIFGLTWWGREGYERVACGSRPPHAHLQNPGQ